MADWLTRDQRHRNMAAIRSSGTAPERRLREVLRLAFPRRQIRDHPDLPGRPDYYLPGLRLAVFADGCFWHSCPSHGHLPDEHRSYWEPKLTRTQERDAMSDAELLRLGIRPVRVWEHDLTAKGLHDAVTQVLLSQDLPPVRVSRQHELGPSQPSKH